MGRQVGGYAADKNPAEVLQSVHRVVVVKTYANVERHGDRPRTEVYGPYATLGAAKGQAKQHAHNHWGTYSSIEVTVESSDVAWKKVEL